MYLGREVKLFYFILQNSPYIRITITQQNLHTLNKCHTHNGWNAGQLHNNGVPIQT